MERAQLAALAADIRSGRVALFHGGRPALRVGGEILPPSVTGVPSSRLTQQSAGVGPVRTREDLVYVTTEKNLALASAASWMSRARGNGRGWLYRVELDDGVELELDDDLPRGPFVSFQLRRARVAEVLDRGVDPNDSRHRIWLERFVRSLG
ncbi:MAG: hypothetical protein JSS74_10550 [Actinobacteria bacterium]|nr:hypothetical protein [Actinomycetota bacterium]